jgi:hypothetical protein
MSSHVFAIERNSWSNVLNFRWIDASEALDGDAGATDFFTCDTGDDVGVEGP